MVRKGREGNFLQSLAIINSYHLLDAYQCASQETYMDYLI